MPTTKAKTIDTMDPYLSSSELHPEDSKGSKDRMLVLKDADNQGPVMDEIHRKGGELKCLREL